jgi:hypothetical protein
MRVDRPDGTSVLVPPYTDIFSPDVDFVTRFRYLMPFDQADEGEPMAGQPYTFTLLDAFGNPIPGATRTDVWTACLVTSPRNLVATVTPDLDIDVSWDEVPAVPGFDPEAGVGFYQIAVNPWDGSSCCQYGSNLIGSTTHLIPWNEYVPPSPGTPDGFDLGVSLSNFDNATYFIQLESFSVAPPGGGGSGLECQTGDIAERLLFEKGEDSIQMITAP